MSRKRGKNLRGFSADLDKFSQHVDIELGTVVQKVAMDVLTGVVTRTPVKTGRARGSWLVGVDKIPTGKGLPKGTELGGNATAEALKQSAKLSEVDGKSVVYIINPLSYAKPLEDGSSEQAPHGMVKVTLEAVSASIKRGLKS